MIWEAQIWIPKETVLMSCQSETETCLTLLTDILLKQSTVHIYTLFIKQYQTYKIATGSLHKQEKGNYKSKFRNFKARKKYQKIRQCRRINYIIIYSLVYLFCFFKPHWSQYFHPKKLNETKRTRILTLSSIRK